MEQKRHLELLIENFEKRLSSSRDKKTLLTKEIEAHEMLFDENKLPLPLEIHTNRRPIKGLHYTDGVINQLRDAYYKYIVQGADINEAGEYFYVSKKSIFDEKGELREKYLKEGAILHIDGRGRVAKKFPPSDINLHYFNEAMARFDYLQYLKNYKPEVAFEPQKRTLADIALQYVWEGKTITNQNKDEIAALFPELHLINGEKLYQRFNEYRKRGERVFDRGDDRKNIKHLKIMETALKFLSEPEQLHSAEKEILLFKSEVKKVSGQIL
jgi:hypothetical protein